MEEVRHKAEDAYIGLRNDFERARFQTEEYIRHNPKKSALIAAGIGFLLGSIMSMKNKKHHRND